MFFNGKMINKLNIDICLFNLKKNTANKKNILKCILVFMNSNNIKGGVVVV